MDFLFFCFFLSVVIFLWALLFRLFTGWYINRALSKKFQLTPGPKPFSYSTLILTTNDFTLTLQNLFVSVNFFGLFSSRFVFLSVNCESVDIEFFHKPHHTLKHKPHTVSENIFIQVCLHILTMLIKKIIIRIGSFSVKRKSISLQASMLNFDYLMQNKAFCVDFDIQEFSIALDDFLIVQFNPISFHPRFDADPILSLINLEAIAIPFGYSVPSIKMSIDKNELKFEKIDCSWIFPRGKIEITTPELKARLSTTFPKFSLNITELSGFFSRHLYEITNLNLDKNQISVKKLKIYNEERLFLKIDQYSGSQISNEEWNHNCNNIDVLYHTKTGLCIIPFIFKEIAPYFEKMMRKPDKIILPAFKLITNRIFFHFKLTDLATMDIKIHDISMENCLIKINNIKVLFNNIKIAIMKTFNILINENDFLEIRFKTFHFHGRTNIIIADFLTETLFAWRAVAPYMLKHYVDHESLPFPVVLKCDLITCVFHDSILHQSLSRANRTLPEILSDSYIREFLLTKRAKELSMSQQSQSISLDKLRALKFAEYVNSVKHNAAHKYKFRFLFYNFLLSMDARGFTEKIKFIHQVDPTTKLYYSDILWEAMFGVNAEMSWSKMEVFAFDIPKPLYYGTSILFKGPVIIAEPRHKEFVDLHFTVDGDKFVSSKSPLKLRMYTDLLISANEFYYYFSDCLQPIFQEMSLCFQSVFPLGVDPSDRLVWWDMMRLQMRGQFLFKANIFEARFMGTRDYRDLTDYMPIKLYGWRMLFREGDVLMNVERWISPRVYNDVDGPISLDLPKINWTFKFHWVSYQGCDTKKYIVLPIVKRFGEPNYDTYKDFRANEIIMDDSTLSFSEIGGIVPNFTLDLAHFEWFAMPLLIFGQSQLMKCQYRKKYGYRMDKRPPLKYFNELKRHGWLRIIANVFVFRIFDHFPISGSQNIQGSSVDLRLNDFQMMTHCDMQLYGSKFSSKFKAESLSINATDLAHYASVDPRRTPSFITMAPLVVEYGDQTIVGIEEITLHFNQFLLRYIQDFMKTTEHIRDKFSKKKSTFCDSSIHDFPIEKVQLNVDVVRVLFVSLESELQAIGILEKTNLSMLGKPLEDEDLTTAIHVLIQQFKFMINTQDPDITGENPLICIEGPDIFTATKCSQLAIKSISLNTSPLDIAALNSILDECFGEEKPAAPPVNMNGNEPSESKVSLLVPEVRISLSTSNEYTTIDLKKINANFHNYVDKTLELSLMISQGHIIDSAKDPGFKDVLVKWEQQSVQKAGRPLIHIQLKMPPKISGAYIFSQVEINIEPTIICYDAKFWDDLILIFKKQMEEKPTYGDPFILMSENDSSMILPFQTFDKSIFPEQQEETQELYKTDKAIKIKKRTKSAKTMMMINYFRLNPISMNVSYRNPDNKILSEINNFQGQLHEIIYHDLSVEPTEIAEKLMADIAKDMIPQFIKHVVGIKRPDKTQEQMIEEWLKSDSDKLSQTDKQKKLLFGPKTVKKK
ncbi:hypothetical protein TRFO_17405 [Tritrichomonas foetus]|uniref:FMP27/BLTP2/Hobbit GFWDK motif-containing RBG unit domain-containing protein n=1 Tax=Tritrichomonas foetus TaxID=1144522 RepID=A0A1J4KT78_9EUKA|nr:hypothetical protein TRFO_17405 [Tritrichomonas foetus]|eukprot:OHT12693.1 hypothetical protein TRFO_17405 [Tritrichomonas foetus]